MQTTPATVTHDDVQHLDADTYPSKALESYKASAVRLAAILTVAGASVQVGHDVQVERWSKAIINSAWNPISALSRTGDAAFWASSPDALAKVRRVMLEVAAVARACGYQMIDAELVDRALGRAVARVPPGIKPSMLVDVVHRRSMEEDAIEGNIIAVASEKGVDTPLLRTIYSLVTALNQVSVLSNTSP